MWEDYFLHYIHVSFQIPLSKYMLPGCGHSIAQNYVTIYIVEWEQHERLIEEHHPDEAWKGFLPFEINTLQDTSRWHINENSAEVEERSEVCTHKLLRTFFRFPISSAFVQVIMLLCNNLTCQNSESRVFVQESIAPIDIAKVGHVNGLEFA